MKKSDPVHDSGSEGELVDDVDADPDFEVSKGEGSSSETTDEETTDLLDPQPSTSATFEKYV